MTSCNMLPTCSPRCLSRAYALRPGRPLTLYPKQSQHLQVNLHIRRRAAQPAHVAASSAAAELIPYTPVKKGSVYDLRFYGPYTVAQVAYNRRDEGFLALGEYLSGSNATGSRMQETQPIVMCYHPDGHKTMQVFVLPRGNNAPGPPPQPGSSAVALEVAGGEVVAALRIEGNVTPEIATRERQRLVAALRSDGIQLADSEAAGSFRIAQYGPLNSLSRRINELWLAVKIG